MAKKKVINTNEENESTRDVGVLANNKKRYISSSTKIMIYTILFVSTLFLSLFLLITSFTVRKEQNVNYQENSNIDYKVFLKDNDFYDQDYLEKDKAYVASLIKKIDADFNYTFKIDTKTDIDFKYDIIGTLVIADGTGKSVFFEKDYKLFENGTANIVQGTFENINKTISIDYNYYNNLANKFKTNYGINTTSNLIVKLKVKEVSKDDNLDLKNNSEMSLTIPLSEREVNINMDYKDVNKNNMVVSSGSVSVNSYLYIVLGIVLLLLSIFFLSKILSTSKSKKSKYDRDIKRILKEYDRLIVNTKTAPDKKGKKVIDIDSFDELLDVRDNLKLPIKYYVIEEHKKCNFYINHDEELYLYIVSSDETDSK